jgi:hypothetical protein
MIKHNIGSPEVDDHVFGALARKSAIGRASLAGP